MPRRRRPRRRPGPAASAPAPRCRRSSPPPLAGAVVGDHRLDAAVRRIERPGRDPRRRPAPERLVHRLADDLVERDLRVLGERLARPRRRARPGSGATGRPARRAPAPPARSPGRAARRARALNERSRSERIVSRCRSSADSEHALGLVDRARARSRRSRASSISAIPDSDCTGPSCRKRASRRRSSCSAVDQLVGEPARSASTSSVPLALTAQQVAGPATLPGRSPRPARRARPKPSPLRARRPRRARRAQAPRSRKPAVP